MNKVQTQVKTKKAWIDQIMHPSLS